MAKNLTEYMIQRLIEVQKGPLCIGSTDKSKWSQINSDLIFKRSLELLHNITKVLSYASLWQKENVLKIMTGVFVLVYTPLIAQEEAEACPDIDARIHWIRKEFTAISNNIKKYEVYELWETLNGEELLVPKDGAKHLSGEEPYSDELYVYKKDTLQGTAGQYTYVYKDAKGDIKFIKKIEADIAESSFENVTEYYIHQKELFFVYKYDHKTNWWAEGNPQSIAQYRYYYCHKTPIRCLEKMIDEETGEKSVDDIANQPNAYADCGNAEVEMEEYFLYFDEL